MDFCGSSLNGMSHDFLLVSEGSPLEASVDQPQNIFEFVNEDYEQVSEAKNDYPQDQTAKLVNGKRPSFEPAAFYWSPYAALNSFHVSQKHSLEHMIDDIVRNAFELEPQHELLQTPLFTLPRIGQHGHVKFEYLNTIRHPSTQVIERQFEDGRFDFLDLLYSGAEESEVDASESEIFGNSNLEIEDGHQTLHQGDLPSQDLESVQGSEQTDIVSMFEATSEFDEHQEDMPLAIVKIRRLKATAVASVEKIEVGNYDDDEDKDDNDDNDKGFIPSAPQSKSKIKAMAFNQKRRLEESEDESKGEIRGPPKSVKPTLVVRSTTLPISVASSTSSSFLPSRAKVSKFKHHSNAGKERNGPFTDLEHDQIFFQVRARRAWEAANPEAPKLRDRPFWEYVLANLHGLGQCRTRLTFGSLKNYWNRVGRAKSQFEERLNGGKNGTLVASSQKAKGRGKAGASK